MPLHDGTGPFRSRPRSGRGNGPCYIRFGNRGIPRSLFHGRQRLLLGITVPFVAAVIRDLLKQSGVLDRIMNASFGKIVTDNAQKMRQKAENKLLDKNSVPPKGEC